MPRTLSVANKLLSLKQRFEITEEYPDGSSTSLYDCTWRFSLFRPTWVLMRGDEEVAVMRKRIFSLTGKWDIDAEIGKFIVRRELLSLRRRMVVVGGPFDRATFNGGLIDLSFSLVHKGRTLARAEGKIFTLRNRHTVELLDSSRTAEHLAAIVMVRLMLDQAEERASSGSSWDIGD